MRHKLEQRAFLLSLLLVSLAFIWILTPFFTAIFWAALLTIIFFPLRRKLGRRWPGRDNWVSLLVLLIGVVVVILPVLFFIMTLVQESATLYQRLESGQLDLAAYIDRLREGFPWVRDLFERFQVDLSNIKERLADGAVLVSSFIAKQAVAIGQNTFRFTVGLAVMLYLAFFLLRDGEKLTQLLIRALPLGDDRERLLFAKFAEVTRATIKGNLVVAVVQGALGGLAFWVLGIESPVFWGFVMAIVSLLPAVGAGLVWGPVAIYLIATDELWRGLILIGYGAGVIGLVDNILRPLLVGRDTKLPDYLVLLTTLGGLGLFGLNGFVIGPLIAALFIAFWNIFMLEFNRPHTVVSGQGESQPQESDP